MIARGNEDGRGNLTQGLGQGLGGLVVGLSAVEQVAGQEDQTGVPVPGQLGKAVQQLPLLPAALGGLLGAALYDFVTNRVLASRVALRPEVLALCAAAAAAALLAVSALCALPASRRKLMQSPKKRGR